MENVLQYLFDETTDSLKVQRESQSTTSAASPFFRYKQMDAGQSTTVRFLPAAPCLAPGLNFLVEKRIVRLRFADPNNEKNEISLSFRPMDVKTADDPVMSQVQALYKEADAEEKAGHDARAKQLRSTASRHWVKPEFFAQGFVVRPGVKEDNIPENPIRIFELNKQLVNKIRNAINSDDPDTMLEGSPEHGTKGTPFIIKKTMTGDGKWPSYTESGFGNKASALTEEHRAAILKYNLFNLTEFLPKIPDEDEYELLAEIMAQSLAGDYLWNPEWESRLKVSTVYKSAGRGKPDADTVEGEVVADVEQASRLLGNKAGRAPSFSTPEDEQSSKKAARQQEARALMERYNQRKAAAQKAAV